MRLIYTETREPVCVGDFVWLSNSKKPARVVHFTKPHKPSSSGKVTVKEDDNERTSEYYVGVIGAEWIEREDRH
jgi:hypothetical protein